ncbi:MAG: hypothetical protein ABSE42_05320 [Bryobacteraceae bacterium]|jgi:hypothetical protein
MDAVELPLLVSFNTPEDAITQMNHFNRRFAIADLAQRGYYSFTNKEVLQAWRDDVPTLGAMNTGQPVLRVPIEQTVSHIMSLYWDHPRREAAHSRLVQNNLRFGLPESLEILPATPVAPGALIWVLTQHEGVRLEATSSTRDCVCKNCGYNSQCPPANSSNPCSNCQKNTWRCA